MLAIDGGKYWSDESFQGEHYPDDTLILDF